MLLAMTPRLVQHGFLAPLKLRRADSSVGRKDIELAKSVNKIKLVFQDWGK
jgi:hypothetical protein